MRHPWTTALAALGVVCCGGQGAPDDTTRDELLIERFDAVDLLIVIDSSCSMIEEQGKLAGIFGSLSSTLTNQGVDWQIAVTTTDVSEPFRGRFMGGEDEIILTGPDGELDRVAWDPTWTLADGVALALDPRRFRSAANDDFGAWCDAIQPYGDSGGKGTPGAWNAPCDGGPAVPGSGGADDGPVVPLVDSLVISEMMIDSPALDSRCEWFELTNLTDDTLDLSGITLSDTGLNHATIPEKTLMAPWSSSVVGRDLTDNCGAPVNIAFPTGLSLADDVRILDATTPDGGEVFSELIGQGTLGSGIEMGLEGALLALDEEENLAALVRAGAKLAILVVSDEEDISPYPADSYARYFTEIKGDPAWRDRGLVSLSGIVGTDATSADTSCAAYGSRYIAVAGYTGGLVGSICDEDFSGTASELGRQLSAFQLELPLSDRTPIRRSRSIRTFGTTPRRTRWCSPRSRRPLGVPPSWPRTSPTDGDQPRERSSNVIISTESSARDSSGPSRSASREIENLPSKKAGSFFTFNTRAPLARLTRYVGFRK